ncbi:MAG: nucleoside hydrolase [Clostridia bacterium]|nr:nucleoside hydrolase [Clostridia bacterium]
MHERQKHRVQRILADIRSPRRKKVIVDTDAYNEMDDQFSILYALCASSKMEVLAVNAAPFYNDRSGSFGDGMVKSYEEIRRLTACLPDGDSIPVFHGSRASIESTSHPAPSPAAENIISEALASDEVLYILTLGAVTNVSSALLMEPKIAEKICVIWLGGTELGKNDVREFNLAQDYAAGQVLLNSGCTVLLCPAFDVTCVLTAGFDELTSLDGVNAHGTYLAALTREFYEAAGSPEHWTRVIWDIAAPAILDNPDCAELEIVTAPVFTDSFTYASDKTRHDMILLKKLDRDAVFKGCFDALRKGR